MSMMKRFAEGISEELGFEGEINAEVLHAAEHRLRQMDAKISIAVVKVFHMKEWRSSFGDPAEWPGEYEQVAEVEAISKTEDGMLSEAWEKTNHIDTPWTENSAVKTTTENSVRSTSVGDVMVLPDGKIMRVESIGFKEIAQVNDEPKKTLEHFPIGAEVKFDYTALRNSNRSCVTPQYPSDSYIEKAKEYEGQAGEITQQHLPGFNYNLTFDDGQIFHIQHNWVMEAENADN